MQQGNPGELRWPALPRDELVRRILGGLTAAPPRSQWLRGPMGIGKTSIAAQVATVLVAEGRELVPVVGLAELRDVPLGALAPALSDPEAAELGLSERAYALVNRVGASPQRYVVLVDDAPLLDEVSAAVVYQLVRVFGVPIVLTARDEHRVSGPVGRLLHEDLVDVVEVGPLTTDELTRLVEAYLREPLRPESARMLFTATEGNVLFLRELIVSAARRGRVVTGPFGAEIEATRLPAHLLDAVRDKFEGVSDEAMRLARMLALSQPWPGDLVDRVSAAGADELRRSAIITVIDDGDRSRIRLAHPFFTEFLLAELPLQTRIELEAAAADALRSLGDDARRFTAAHLLIDHPDADPAELEWAAGVAVAAGDMSAALRLARAARERGGGFGAVLFEAMAASELDDAAADEAFAAALAAAATDDERVLVGLRLGHHLAYRRRDPLAAAAQAEALSQSVGAGAAALEPEVLKWRLMAGEHVEVASAVMAETDQPLAVVSAGLGASMLATMAGDADRARAAIAATRPHVEATATALPQAASLLDLSEFLVHVAEGDIEQARAYAHERRLNSSPDAAGVWSYTLALIELHSGRPDLAAPLAQLAVRQLEWRDFTGLVGAAIALAATAAALTGDTATATALLKRLDANALLDVKTALQAAEAEVWLATAPDERAAALATLAEVVERAVTLQHHLLGVLTASVAIRCGRADAVTATLQPAAQSTPSPLIATVAEAARAAVDGDHAVCMELAPRLRRAGLAATARTLVEAVSQQVADAALRRRAHVLAGELATITLADPLNRAPDPYALSAREWEVASAAARRLRNREIADQLGISTRTVENHLANVYRKLGATGRDELAELIG